MGVNVKHIFYDVKSILYNMVMPGFTTSISGTLFTMVSHIYHHICYNFKCMKLHLHTCLATACLHQTVNMASHLLSVKIMLTPALLHLLDIRSNVIFTEIDVTNPSGFTTYTMDLTYI